MGLRNLHKEKCPRKFMCTRKPGQDRQSLVHSFG